MSVTIDQPLAEPAKTTILRLRLQRAALAALLGVASCGPAHAEIHTVTSVPVIVDGDTLYLDGVKIRLEGPDTPESWHPRCDAELIVALRAKERLRALVGDGTGVVYETRGKHDRYGRLLADVYDNDGQDIGNVLIAEGLAIRWTPGRASWVARARHWCGPDWSEN